MMIGYNIIIGEILLDKADWDSYDKHYKIDPNPPIIDKVETFYMADDSKWPDVLVKCDIFKSKSEARKNGWNKEIPDGFSYEIIGKFKKQVVIYKMTPELRQCLDKINQWYRDRCDICEKLYQGDICSDCIQHVIEREKKILDLQKRRDILG